MSAPEKLNQMFRAPKLTWTRIILALAVAVVTDSLQFIFGPLPFVDQAIDVIAFVLTAWALGFHLLLLPTFIAEFFPIVDMLPTWTACVIAVIALRKRDQNKSSPVALPPKSAKPPTVTDLPP
jgi:polyferredoxin